MNYQDIVKSYRLNSICIYSHKDLKYGSLFNDSYNIHHIPTEKEIDALIECNIIFLINIGVDIFFKHIGNNNFERIYNEFPSRRHFIMSEISGNNCEMFNIIGMV